LADRRSVRTALLRPGAAAGRGKKRIATRSRWHFGGGPGYCDGCRREGRPCAKGEPGSDGALCPYIENEPLSDAGWQAWDILTRCAGQLRFVPGAVIGLDLGAALGMAAAAGYDAMALAELLPAGEAGLVAAINERLKRDNE
jgi:hypothetical protein